MRQMTSVVTELMKIVEMVEDAETPVKRKVYKVVQAEYVR